MGIVVIGDVFIDVKGYSTAPFIPGGRNAGVIQQIHGGVGRNVVEDIANILKDYGHSYICQEILEQSELTAQFNRTSLNTFRINTQGSHQVYAQGKERHGNLAGCF